MRSLATRGPGARSARALPDAIAACKVGLRPRDRGTSVSARAMLPSRRCRCLAGVMTPEFGAANQLREDRHARLHDFVAINKYDRKEQGCAARRLASSISAIANCSRRRRTRCLCSEPSPRLQRRRRHRALYRAIPQRAKEKAAPGKLPKIGNKASTVAHSIVPSARVRYLAEIAEAVRNCTNGPTSRRVAANGSNSSHRGCSAT